MVERASFARERRSKASPLLILGFIKIRKGGAAGLAVGISYSVPLMQLKVSFGLAGFQSGPPLNLNPSIALAALVVNRSSFQCFTQQREFVASKDDKSTGML